MLGALIGDISGSRYEHHNIKTKKFDLLNHYCRPTDDSIMSLAIANAILDCNGTYTLLGKKSVLRMQELGRKYQNAGYGGHFRHWLKDG